MKKNLLKTIFVFIFLLLVSPVLAYYSPGSPAGFVNDYAGMINTSDESALEKKLVDFEAESSNEIVVVTIPSLEGDTIENFAVELFEEWRIGKTDNDNGVLILVSRDDRKMRIEVGYGLEGALTDSQSYWIIDDIIKPAFREENYYQGIDEAVDKIISATEGEYLPSAEERNPDVSGFIFFIFFTISIIMWIASMLGASRSWWLGGVLGGVSSVILGLIFGFVYTGMASMLILIPLGLFFDYILSKNYQKHKAVGSVPWWYGKGGSGGSGSSGGFGGFGGGSSGGGGASGSW